MADQIPLVDYLVLGDEPHLVATTCTSCGAQFFDRRNACAACSALEFERVPVPTDGTLRSFTIVAFVSVTRSTSSTLSIVDLEATGDAALGTPLLVAATVLGLWYGFGAGERPRSG